MLASFSGQGIDLHELHFNEHVHMVYSKNSLLMPLMP